MGMPLTPLPSMPLLMAPPEEWVAYLEGEMSALPRQPMTRQRRDPRSAYLTLLAGVLTSASLACDLLLPLKSLQGCLWPLRTGRNWPPMGITMAGLARMESVREMVHAVSRENVAGAFLEAGVWRGGMSLYATAAMRAYGLGDRPVYLCDSFQGLPLPRRGSLRPDEETAPLVNRTLAVDTRRVLDQFSRFGLHTAPVRAVPGYFVDSLPTLRAELLKKNEKIAILRMDGDMYDSTADILYNLYDRVSVGGFVVIDDFGWAHEEDGKTSWGAKTAVLDFRARHGIEGDTAHAIKDIDGYGAWFRKAREVSVDIEAYRASVANSDQKALRPTTQPELKELRASYEAETSDADRRRRQSLEEHHPGKIRTG